MISRGTLLLVFHELYLLYKNTKLYISLEIYSHSKYMNTIQYENAIRISLCVANIVQTRHILENNEIRLH